MLLDNPWQDSKSYSCEGFFMAGEPQMPIFAGLDNWLTVSIIDCLGFSAWKIIDIIFGKSLYCNYLSI